ncbi:MAG TPA: hypothetical protein O0X74_04800, partial [Methanocorpusculum sp.]|nr:hypothetical protein [Methanocorpusculum sp.]
KEQSNVFSPTETPLKEHQPNKTKSEKSLELIARRALVGSIRPDSGEYTIQKPKTKKKYPVVILWNYSTFFRVFLS